MRICAAAALRRIDGLKRVESRRKRRGVRKTPSRQTRYLSSPHYLTAIKHMQILQRKQQWSSRRIDGVEGEMRSGAEDAKRRGARKTPSQQPRYLSSATLPHRGEECVGEILSLSTGSSCAPEIWQRCGSGEFSVVLIHADLRSGSEKNRWAGKR